MIYVYNIYIPINMFNYLKKQPLTTNITHQHFCGDFMRNITREQGYVPIIDRDFASWHYFWELCRVPGENFRISNGFS